MLFLKKWAAARNAIKFILRELQVIVEWGIRNLPGETGILIRRWYYGLVLKSVGRKLRIYPGVYLMGARHIVIGDHCTIAHNAMVQAGEPFGLEAECRVLENPEYYQQPGNVTLGNHVYLSAGCYILGNGGVHIDDFCCCASLSAIISFSNHYRSFSRPDDRSVYFTHGCGSEHECYVSGPVVLKQNTALAARVLILPGVTIDKDSFVAVGAVVPKGKYSSNAFIAGNPGVSVGVRYKSEGSVE